jgi:hypothetical protein
MDTYSKGKYVEPDVKVEITYSCEGRKYVTDLLKGWKDKEHLTVKKALEDEGFSNITEEEVQTFDKQKDKKVAALKLNDEMFTNEHCYLPLNAPITITYNTLKIGIGSNSSQFMGQNYEDVVKDLKNSGFTNSHDLRPGDYIIHFPKSSDSLDKALGFGTSDGSCKDMFDKTLLLTDEFKMKNANTIKDYYSEKQACVYIGKLSSSITLSTGQVLDANVKLIVDMNAQSDNLNKCGHNDAKGDRYKEGNVGLISLHGTKADTFWDWDYETTYWWLQNSSNRADDDTRFYSFGG